MFGLCFRGAFVWFFLNFGVIFAWYVLKFSRAGIFGFVQGFLQSGFLRPTWASSGSFFQAVVSLREGILREV